MFRVGEKRVKNLSMREEKRVVQGDPELGWL